jgi:polysaccharide export outer membrane protein
MASRKGSFSLTLGGRTGKLRRLRFHVRISLQAPHCKAATQGAGFIEGEMKGLLEYKPLSFTICLSLVLLLTSPPSRAQNAQDEPTSQTSQAVQTPTTNTDLTAGNASANPDRSPGTLADPNYILGPEDVIGIDVFSVPELSITARIANDGMISLPLIGRVQAAGFTAEQFRQELADKWGENYLQDPQVTVFVREFVSRPVSVIGAVEKPGLYPLAGRRTLVEMLSMAGGLGKKSSAPAGHTVYVTRKSGFGDLQPPEGMRLVAPDQVEIELKRLLYSHDEALNIGIKPSDVISVSKADVIYVVGAVKQPGGFVMEDRDNITVMQAVAMAQGFFGSPAKSAARIIRRNQDGKRTEIPVNVSKIFKGHAPDVVLAANDILYIPDSSSKNAAKRAMDSGVGLATTTLSGVIIWH